MMTRSSKKLKNAGEVKSSSLESTSAKDKTDKRMATGSAETKNIAVSLSEMPNLFKKGGGFAVF